jgi:hypothetical protein
MRRLIPLLILLLVVLASPAAAADVETATAELGAVRAELTWEPGLPSTTKPSLKITRSGQEFVSEPARCPTGEDDKLFCEQPGVLRDHKPILARDLDGDGEPEVLVEMYTGGAHCCVISRIYRFDGAGYSSVRTDWADTGFRLRDVEGDGKVELVTADPRFAYAFTSFADSAFPVQVYAYEAGELDDVSAGYPQLIRRDARSWWHTYTTSRRGGDARDARGVLAAWLADKYRLGEAADGWRRIRRALRRGDLRAGGGWANDEKYVRLLRRSLRAWGYTGSL